MTPEEILKNLPPLTLESIEQVYVGKVNSCTCGCKGKYTLTSEDPKAVKKVIRKLKSCVAQGSFPWVEGKVLIWAYKEYLYRVFFVKELV